MRLTGEKEDSYTIIRKSHGNFPEYMTFKLKPEKNSRY